MNLLRILRVRPALRIGLAYAVFAASWIWFSDSLLEWLVSDPDSLTWVQSIKGTVFVLLTSLLLYHLIRRNEQRREELLAKLHHEAERLAHFMAINPAAAYSLKSDPAVQGGFLVDYVSPRVEQITGFAPSQWLQTPGLWLARVHPEDRERAFQAQEHLAQEGIVAHEYRWQHADGSYRWIYDQVVRTAGAQGEGPVLVGAWLDVTDRLQAQEQLRLTAQVFESSHEGILITDADNRMVSVNRALTAITGYDKEELLGRNPAMFSSGRQSSDFFKTMWQALRADGHWQGEVWNRRKDGVIYPEWLSVSTIRDAQGQITHHIGIVADLSRMKDAEEKIRFLSNFDPLTGLCNRVLLQDRASLALAAARRAQTKVALMYLDLDRFKNINDSLGHAMGDRVLQQLAERLKTHLHPDDTICRPGGDEFILLLPNTDAQGAAHVAERALALVREPMQLDGQRLSLSASVGLALYPDNGEDLERLSQCADAALFRAKQKGRNSFQFFTQQMHDRAYEMLVVENDLHRALENNEFELYYQSQADAHSLAVIGVEALLRWRHPEWGMVSPARFIPVAEESGQIRAIGDWVLHAAVQQNAMWRAQGLPVVPVAINLSMAQFRDQGLPQAVASALSRSGIEPALLELELTESIAMEDSDFTIAMVERLRQLGVGLSIDDFGTGYSSLSYLKRFKLDKLKIDQSFVRDLPRNPDDRAIVTGIVGLAHSLGFRTIAEGVETREQLDILRTLECDEFQGYYFSKPVPAEEFASLLARQGRAPSQGGALQAGKNPSTDR